MRTENIEEMESKMKKEDNVNTIPKGSGAAESEPGPRAEVLESAMGKYCFIPDSSFNDLNDEYEPAKRFCSH